MNDQGCKTGEDSSKERRSAKDVVEGCNQSAQGGLVDEIDGHVASCGSRTQRP